MAEPSFRAARPVRLPPDIPGLSRDPAAIRRRIELLEQLLERSLTVPLIGRKIGLDAIAGLVPVAGDALAAVLGAWIVWEAHRLGMSRWKLARMGLNVALDAALGAIPLVGDAFDFVFRSNSMNLAMIRRHLDRHHPALAVIEGGRTR